MGKVKSTVITVILALLMAVAAFFAFISFPVGKVNRLNSIASTIHLGADYSGYAYTTVCPKGVLTAEEYNLLDEKDDEGNATADKYTKVGSLYAEKEKYENVDELKAQVAADASIVNKRLGQKGYSSYSVAVEDGLALKISVPTNYTYAAYKGYDSTSLSNDLNGATAVFTNMIADGLLTLRTTDSTITIDTDDGDLTYVPREDDLTDTALVNGSKTYSLTGNDDAAEYFSKVSAGSFGTQAAITFDFTKEGRSKFSSVTTRAASSSSHIIYFFVGDTQVLSFNCTATVDQASLSLQSDSRTSAENAAITLNSAIKGDVLLTDFNAVSEVLTSTAAGGENAALFALIASLIVLVVLVVLSIVFFKRLGAVNAMMAILMALVEVYALQLLSIQVTFAVILASLIGLAVLMTANAIVFAEVKRLVATGRTIQASVKEAYKNVLMAVTDIHIVLVVAALLFATVAVGELAACGLIMLVATVASYVLYWFTRFMWYVTSSPVRDKFGFAGLKRVVYEDD